MRASECEPEELVSYVTGKKNSGDFTTMNRWRSQNMGNRNIGAWTLLFATGVCLLSLAACRGEESADDSVVAQPPRSARAISFEDSLARDWVVAKRLNLGSVSRSGLQPQPRTDVEFQNAFDSDPIVISAGDELLVSMGMLSLGASVPTGDRPRFRVDLVGSGGERRLLEATGQADFGIDEWSQRRVSLPTDLGSPAVLRFSVAPPEDPDPAGPAAFAVWGAPRVLTTGETRRPNIIFVVFDTLRADHTEPYGYHRKTTPFLSHLAAQGALVEQVVATYPTTLTSHWSMFTGLFPARHGVYPGAGRRQSPSRTLANHFQEAGYRTAAFTEGGFVHSIFGFDNGFDLYHDGPTKGINDLSGSAKDTFHLASTWLSEAKEDPFFLFLHTYEVHTPYEPSEAYRELYAKGYDGRWSDVYPPLATFAINNEKTDPTAEERAHIVNLYDAEIRELDALFEELWSRLDDLGILEDTIVVITSDHGEDFFEHGWLSHGTTLYDPALMIPFIIVGADGVEAGLRLDCQRSQPDFMPTLLDLAGLQIPDDLDGLSMLPALRAGRCEREHAAFSELLSATYKRQDDLPIVSLRKGNKKLIRHIPSGALEAYDLGSDPAEQQSAIDPTFRELEMELDAYIGTRPDHVVEGDEEIPLDVQARLRALGYAP
jgi:arylsulfatase A-like enzyme